MSQGWLDPEEERRALGYLEERFGIPRCAFADHRLLARGEHICAVRQGAASAWDALRGTYAGLKLLKVTGSGSYKPTSRGVQVFGALATRNVCDLGEADLHALIEGRSLPWSEGKGFVILRHAGAVVGIGLVREGHLVSQLPQAMTMHVKLPAAGPRR